MADSQVVPLSVVMVLNKMEKSIKEKGPAKVFRLLNCKVYFLIRILYLSFKVQMNFVKCLRLERIDRTNLNFKTSREIIHASRFR